jgi:hypothetical protein
MFEYEVNEDVCVFDETLNTMETLSSLSITVDLGF